MYRGVLYNTDTIETGNHAYRGRGRMELENELFLATIEWTWECCLKQKESDNEKSVALCKAYKGGQFGLLQVDQTDEQGKIVYHKVLPYRYDNIIYLGCGIFCLFQRHQH